MTIAAACGGARDLQRQPDRAGSYFGAASATQSRHP